MSQNTYQQLHSVIETFNITLESCGIISTITYNETTDRLESAGSIKTLIAINDTLAKALHEYEHEE